MTQATTATESDGIAYGGYGGDQTFLQRAGTVAQRRHTHKATQLAPVAASSTVPLPDTPTSIPTSSERDLSLTASSGGSSLDLDQSPTSSITADEHSLTSVTSQSVDMDDFAVSELPQPYIPLRKTSASSLRQKATSPVDGYSAIGAESPYHSYFPERVSSHISSPRMRRDRQTPTSGYPESISPKESGHAFAGPPRGRPRGMTTASQRGPGDFSAQFRSPSIPDLRGSARTHMSSTYKPERGPTSRDPSIAFRNPPPIRWKDSEEVRASFRSALTNASYATYASSGYYELSETERSSVITQSSSLSYSSRRKTASVADDDDFDACDYIDMYAQGFDEDEDEEKAQRRPRASIIDPAIQAPLSLHEEAPVRPSSIQKVSALEDRPTVPTKYDSKLDDEIPLPKSPTIRRSTPSSPLVLHPVNPTPPPSPTSPLLTSLKVEDTPGSQPVTPLSRRDISPLDAAGFEPSPLESEATGFFPPMEPALRESLSQGTSQKSSTVVETGPVPRDRYGFKKANQYVTVEQYDAWNAKYTEYLERRRTKWEIMMIQWGLAISNPVRFPPRSDKIKRYIRKGIPPEWRGACWFWYAGGPTRLAQNPGLYERLVHEAENGQLNDADREIIERDLNRTFPDNIEFKPDPEPGVTHDEELPIIQALRRVLQAFAIHNPNIGYCQSLNFLAGMLLLFLRDEEKAFHLLNVICNVHLPGTHAKVLEANVDVGVLMTCIRDSMPHVWAKIDDVNEGGRGPINTTRLPTVSLATTPWFMSCFVGNLPVESVLRVWDCFFYEGSKTLFRIALAVFKTGENDIRNVSEHSEVFQVVQAIPRRLLNVNALMESCYKRRNGFGHLSQDVVDGRRRERRSALQKDRDLKNGHVVEETQRPPSRGRRGTFSRAASRARSLNRARSKKRDPTQNEPMPPPQPSPLRAQF